MLIVSGASRPMPRQTAYKRRFSLPELYAAYVLVPRAVLVLARNRRRSLIDPWFIEHLMLAVTEVNGCAACSWAHTKAALRQGMTAEEIAGFLSGEGSVVSPREAKGILFAQHYADTRGFPRRSAYETIVDEYGPERARVILSAVQVMQAGNIYGIPFSAFSARLAGKPYAGSTPAYELLMQAGGIIVIPAALIHALLRRLAGLPNVRLDPDNT